MDYKLVLPEPPFPARDLKFRQGGMPFDIEHYRGHDPRSGDPLDDKQFIQQLIADLLGGLPDDLDSHRRCLSSLLNRMSIVKVIGLGCGVSAEEAEIFGVSCLRAIGRTLGVGYLDKSGNPTFSLPALEQLSPTKRKSMIVQAMGRFVGWLQNELMPAVVARRHYTAAEPVPTSTTTRRADADKPLTEKELCVVRILAGTPARGALTGKEIINASKQKGEMIEQSDLTRNIIPGLKRKGIEIENERGAGYYLTDSKQKAQFATK